MTTQSPVRGWTPKMLSALGVVTAGVLCLALAACGAPAGEAADSPAQAPAESIGSGVGSCSLDLADAGDEAEIQAVLNAEGNSVVSQDIDALMRLWTEDGRVSDAKNTPDSADDDQNWDGRDAIRHRYVRTVFPGAPDTAQHPDLQIAIEGDRATVTGTTQIGDEVSPAGDRWELARVDGCWVLKSLTYNLEPKP